MNSIGSILASARKAKKLSQPELSAELKKLGINKSHKSVSAWEKGLAEPNFTTLMALSKILGITDIYDRYYGDTPEHPYTLLNEEGKAKADEYIELLVDSGRYAKHIADIIEFIPREVKLFYLPASAGPGEFLETSDDFEMVSLPQDAPADTDFMIRIQGDSMEPQFHDEELVWIEQTECLNPGDIGLFFLDGMTYFKKYVVSKTGTFLVSLNPDYAPKPVSEYSTFKIFGKLATD